MWQNIKSALYPLFAKETRQELVSESAIKQ